MVQHFIGFLSHLPDSSKVVSHFFKCKTEDTTEICYVFIPKLTGVLAWDAEYFWQVAHFERNVLMQFFIPGQYYSCVAVAYVLVMPECALWSSVRTVFWLLVGMTNLVLLRITMSTSSIRLIESRWRRVLNWLISTVGSPVSTAFCRAALCGDFVPSLMQSQADCTLW